MINWAFSGKDVVVYPHMGVVSVLDAWLGGEQRPSDSCPENVDISTPNAHYLLNICVEYL